MVAIVRITGSGQITLPAEVRRKLNLEKGDYVQVFDPRDGEVVLRRLMTIDELEGSIPALERDDVDDDFGNIIREAREEEAERIVAELNDACEMAVQ